MIHAEIRRDRRIGIKTDYVGLEAIKEIPGSRWDTPSDQWTLPLSWASCVMLKGSFGGDVAPGPDLKAWTDKEYKERIVPCVRLRHQMDAEGSPSLYPFQRAGSEFLRLAGDCVLADEPGLGKTIQVIDALKGLKGCLPALVVCPKSMQLQWQRELAKWWPESRSEVITGTATQRAKQLKAAAHADVTIINLEALRLHSRLAPYGSIELKRCINCDAHSQNKPWQCERCQKDLNRLPFRTVICDEAHRIKDPYAKQTRALWAVMHGKTVTRRWALTGTPVANHPGDLWSIMHGISPLEYPSRTKFLDRYALLSWNVWGGMEIVGISPTHRGEFFQILDPRFRRMPKDAVLPWLPPKIFQRRDLEMEPRQRKAYDQMVNQMISELETGLLMAVNPLSQVTRLMQFASSYAEVEVDGSLRLAPPSNKINELMDVLNDLEGESVVVSAESRQLIELASERLTEAKIPWNWIVGGMTPEQRDRAIQDFQDGRVRVMLFTIKAGGVGITLTKATYMVRLQRSFSNIENLQALDRIHRIGSEQHDKITIVDLVTQGTIEERQLDLLEGKQERLEEIVRDREFLRHLITGA